jgi:hypothetical protein
VRFAVMRVLFFSPFGHWGLHNQVDGMLIRALNLRGHESMVLRCDAIYPNCSSVDRDQNCAWCVKAGTELFDAFQATQRFLNDFIRPGEREEAAAQAESLPRDEVATAVFDGLPVGNWVESTIRTRHRNEFGSGVWSDAVIAEFRTYLADALVTYRAVLRAIDETEAACLVLFNGRFYPYRAAMEAAKALGIDFIVHERGMMKGSFWFYDRDNCETTAMTGEVFMAHGGAPLTPADIDAVEAQFAVRGLGTANCFSFESETGGAVSPLTRLALPPDAKVIGLFTSSTDEIGLRYDRPELSQELLIENLFALFADRPEYVVIRHHPFLTGKNWRKNSNALVERYREQRSRAPRNFRIVMPEETVSSYDIFPLMNHAIAPWSTIGLELPFYGVKTLVLQGSYASPAFDRLLDSFEREALTAGLMPFVEDETPYGPEDYCRLYRFIHAAVIRSSFLFKGITIRNVFYTGDLPPPDANLIPGADPLLDQICDRITEGGPLFGHAAPFTAADERREATLIRERVAARLGSMRAQRLPARDQFALMHTEVRGICTEVEQLTAALEASRKEVEALCATAVEPQWRSLRRSWRRWSQNR